MIQNYVSMLFYVSSEYNLNMWKLNKKSDAVGIMVVYSSISLWTNRDYNHEYQLTIL